MLIDTNLSLYLIKTHVERLLKEQGGNIYFIIIIYNKPIHKLCNNNNNLYKSLTLTVKGNKTTSVGWSNCFYSFKFSLQRGTKTEIT